MRWLLLVIGLLLAASAFAQSTPPKYDKDECVALAHRIDASVKAKQTITQADRTQYDRCAHFFDCDQVTEGDWMKYKTHEALLRYILKTCQHYDPPRKLRLKEE